MFQVLLSQNAQDRSQKTFYEAMHNIKKASTEPEEAPKKGPVKTLSKENR